MVVIQRGVESSFGAHELFFSTTDQRGLITSGNNVFCRVAEYRPDELCGQPHNIIRHPDMPRVVFKLLWDTIGAGSTVAAYVKNRSQTGKFYWALAVVRPAGDGYLSIRMKPTTELLDIVEGVYAELLDIENRSEASGARRSEAMEQSGEVLGQRLATLGFDSYEHFMWTALTQEVQAGVPAFDSAHARLCSSEDRDGMELDQQLRHELSILNEHRRTGDQIATRTQSLFELAEEGQLLALNAVLAAHRLGDDGAALGAVSDILRATFPLVVKHATDTLERISETRRRLDSVGFGVSLAILGRAMGTQFQDELRARESMATVDDAIVDNTGAPFRLLTDFARHDTEATIAELLTELTTVQECIAEVDESSSLLMRQLQHLSTIERNGRTEAARSNEFTSFDSLFDYVRKQVGAAMEELRTISYQLNQLKRDDLDATRAAFRSAFVAA